MNGEIPEKGQLSDYGIVAFGIPLTTRHGIAVELAEMLKFAHSVSVKGLGKYIENVFYDSVWCGCNIELKPGLNKSSVEAEEIKNCALAHISQFAWFGNVLHGEPCPA